MPLDNRTEMVELAAESGEFPRLRDFIERTCMCAGCDAGQIARTQLVMEELFTNTVKYGRNDSAPARIVVSIEAGDQHTLTVCYEDSAPKHDPFASTAQMENLLASLTHRRVGGLGVVIIQQLGNGVRYEWTGNKNRVIFSVATELVWR